MTALQAASSQQQFYDKLDELVKTAKNLIVTGFGDAKPEEATKQHLIEPLLTALGYKTTNYDKEFHILNDDVDYLLKDRHPLMFLEAKSLHDPAKDLFKKHQEQVTRYIYNYRRTPPDKLRGEEPINWIVLSNFAQWYFIRVHEEVPSFSFTLDNIVSRREEFWELLALENVVANRIDELYDQRQKADLDKRFLADLKRWRLIIANGFALRNPDLSIPDLTKASQQLLDRFIFCRMLETNRLIEHDTLARRFARYIQLYGNPPTKPFSEVLKESLFAEIKRDFNTELFIRPQLCDQLAIDNIAMAIVIGDEPLTPDVAGQCGFEQGQGELLASYKHLYGYDFSRMSTDIMGAVYERFLAHKLDRKDGRITIEDTNELRKKEGIYYTPRYIVDYIVANTVGRKIDPILNEALALLGYKNYKGAVAKIRELSQIKVLDAAMGSGSFLLRAFDTFVDAYAAYNTECAKRKQAHGQSTGMLFDAGRELPEPVEYIGRLVVTENIFGVDLDEQAVEVAKLNLWMRLMKVEREYIRESVTIRKNGDKPLNLLPTLSNNLKRGNSLIDDPSVAGDAAFNWKGEFPDIMQHGGFDCVIGNPPYGMLQPHNTPEDVLAFFRRTYVAAEFKIDLFHLFLQRGISLLKASDRFGYIIPTSILNNVYVQVLRDWIVEHCCIEQIAISREMVFPDADVHTCILLLKKETDATKRSTQTVLTTTELSEALALTPKSFSHVSQASFSTQSGGVWNILVNEGNSSLINKLTKSFPRLEEVGVINRGLITGDRGKYFSPTKKSPAYVPILQGADVHRYHTLPPSEFVSLEKPAAAGGSWDADVHLAPHKIVVRQISRTPTASLIRTPIAVTGNIFTVRAKSKSLRDELHLLGIINSQLTDFFWRTMFADFKTSFPQVTIASLAQLPTKMADPKSKRQTALSKEIVKSVEAIRVAHDGVWFLPQALQKKAAKLHRTDCALAHYLQKDYRASVTAEVLIDDLWRKGFVRGIVVQSGKKHLTIAAEVSDAKDAAPAIHPIVRLTFTNPALQQFMYASWRGFLETNARKTIWTTGKTPQPVYDLIVNGLQPLVFLHPAAPANLKTIRDLMKSVAKEVGTSDLAALEQEIADTDQAIDRLVYDLYGLTEEEIAIVESATK